MKIERVVKELHKDELDLINLLKLYIGVETLTHCIEGLDPEDPNYKILYEYLLARLHDLNDLSHDIELLRL